MYDNDSNVSAQRGNEYSVLFFMMDVRLLCGACLGGVCQRTIRLVS